MDYLYWTCFYHTGRIDYYLLYKKLGLKKYDGLYPKERKVTHQLRSGQGELLF